MNFLSEFDLLTYDDGSLSLTGLTGNSAIYTRTTGFGVTEGDTSDELADTPIMKFELHSEHINFSLEVTRMEDFDIIEAMLANVRSQLKAAAPADI